MTPFISLDDYLRPFPIRSLRREGGFGVWIGDILFLGDDLFPLDPTVHLYLFGNDFRSYTVSLTLNVQYSNTPSSVLQRWDRATRNKHQGKKQNQPEKHKNQ